MNKENHPCPRVELIHFMGKTSGFATQDSDLVKVQLIAHELLPPKSVMAWNEAHGITKDSGVRLATEWAQFLDWPIVVFEEVKEFTVVKRLKGG